MGSKYVDVTAIMQVVGNVFNNPQILVSVRLPTDIFRAPSRRTPKP